MLHWLLDWGGDLSFLEEQVHRVWSFPSGCGEWCGRLAFSRFTLMLLPEDGQLFGHHKTWQMSECL